jgi:hypothetical protein
MYSHPCRVGQFNPPFFVWLLIIGAFLFNISAVQAKSKQWPAQCVHPVTGELKPNASAHPQCDEAIEALSKGSSANSNMPPLEIEPTTHDFGTVNIGQSSAERQITLFNNSDQALQLDFIDELGNVTTTLDELGNVTTAFGYQTLDQFGNPTTVSEFRITDDSCSNTELDTSPSPSAACELTLVFHPEGLGTKTFNLPIPYLDELGNPTSLAVPLMGQGVDIPIPNIEATLRSHDFEEVNIGSESDVQTIRISNSGDAELTIGQVTLPNTADFIILYDFCSQKTLSPNQNCSLRIQFKPQTVGPKTATLSIASDDPSTPTLEIALKGEATLPPMPNIEMEEASYDFGETQVGTASRYLVARVMNTGNAPLQLGQISIVGSEFIIKYNLCSNKTLGASRYCAVIMQFKPQTAGAKTANLSIASNDPDMPTLDVPLNGTGTGWCQGNYEQGFSTYPQTPDFGTELVGNTKSMQINVHTWARGCGALKIEAINVIGTDEAEFSITDQRCYHGSYNDTSYSSCRFKAVFSPTAEGTKASELALTFNDTTSKTIPLTAKAVTTGQPNILIYPNAHDFGKATAGTYGNSQSFTLKNTGDINVKFQSISLIGQNSTDFRAYSWRCLRNGLNPSEQCNISTRFTPKTLGEKQANLRINSNAPLVEAALTGTGTEAADCSDDHITIESTSSGPWATRLNGDKWWHYSGDSDAWTRLKTPYDNDNVAPNRPIEGDVVRIKAGHTISAIPYTRIRALCIEANGTLESATGIQYPYLSVYATDYIENLGTIKGLNGAHETTDATGCTAHSWYNQKNCAQPGAGIHLSVGYGSLFRNEGTIVAGHGGDGKRYGAPGGWIGVYGGGLNNTGDLGIINAGRGGHITGTQSGQAGRGGGVSMWGNDYFTSDGRGIYGGNGGNCNANATEPQMGGHGGNMRLNARNTVNLLNGTFATGKGGKNCDTSGGTNGQDGRFNTDPSVLTVSGESLKIEGGEVTIFGGEGWSLNFNNLSDDAVTATGNLTIAVGEGGNLNMSNNTGQIFKSAGQVTLFSDNIALDEGVALSSMIEAKNIVVAPSKTLRDVSLSAPNKVSGEPKAVLPITLTLSNGGPEKDSYALSVTNTAGWEVGQLPYTVELEGLSSVEIVMNVTLPETGGVTDVISVNAMSQHDPEANATVSVQVAVNQEAQQATLDEGILNLPGIDTDVDGGDVTISSSEASGIDLSNVGGSKVVSATGKVTLAVSENGVIDLRGNNSAILETTGEVIIYGDPANILLDPGVELKDIIKASNIVILPSKPSHDAALTGPSNLSKPVNAIVPLRFMLANTGMAADVYTITVTDSANWRMTSLPPSKRIKGLDNVDLLMNVTLPDTVGETNVITVTATSQAEPSLVVTAKVNLTVTSASLSGTVVGVSPINTSGMCPNSGQISRMCSNRGVITDAKLDSNASVSGGRFAGSIDNQGMIAQATIESGAVLHGGKLSGRILNEGTLTDFEFVGAEIRGGTLSGKIRNRSQVGGVFIDVELAANTRIEGGAVAGEVSGDADAPAALTDIEIKSGTHLSHVTLSDAVQLDGAVTFSAVHLAPDLHLTGGTVRGHMIGDPNAPALLENINIEAGSQLSAVIIGEGVKLPKALSLGEGVIFTDHNMIPHDVELLEILPSRGEEIPGVHYEKRRVDLSADVFEPSDGILSAINEILIFKDNGWAFTQQADSGLMTLTIDTASFSLLPVSIQHSTGPAGLEIQGSQGISFITDTGLNILTRPMLEAPEAFQSALNALGLTEFTVQGNGNLSIPGQDNVWYSANPDGLSFEVSGDIGSTGLMMLDSPVLSGTPSAVLAFTDNSGNVRQQLIYPAPAEPEALYGTAQNVKIETHGVINFSLKGQRYRGVVDYAVTSGDGSTTQGLQVEPIADANGDGIKDIVLKYPNGNRQRMFVLE